MDSLDFRSASFFKTKNALYALATRLFPICRSITGEGFRTSLEILKEEFENGGGGVASSLFQIHTLASGTKVFDWTIPPEWSVKDAYIITPQNEKICDFKKHNLHLLNYSTSIDTTLEFEELDKHLYSLKELPNAIPYVTSYYKKRWGFCLTHHQRLKLTRGKYRVFIDTKHDEKGVLNYADILIPSTTNAKDEILISTYLCHPSMANNELSGPCVAIFLAKWLHTLTKRKYNYRFVFVPETIGSIAYLSKHLKHLKQNVKAGFVLSCVGDEGAYSLIHSPSANTLGDKIALHTLKNKKNFKEFNFLQRGSDERQYCSPLVNLPVVCVCRTRFGDFKEYHTSLDDLTLITPKGLGESLEAMEEIILNLENNAIYKSTTFCEPNLGKRGLYPTLNLRNQPPQISTFLAFCDGKNDVLDIAQMMNLQGYELENIIRDLLKHNLIKRIKP
ncbi:DUF4910 domain-containing protein [Campylobacter upsaliensis]|uniref:DUF4910 domain-containing protein n=1 Tax=Campylobacter upsaliensis TaxID=28080 RepID=UPI000E1562F1|nr:DUF4910 domain-containing protein [Campylobacter upsaliensis]SUX19098.1 Uncharacterized protein conserved in bacteria with an aminopeptidase-like domain [Campylobacter upsaliensis]HEP3232282.1 DUF4910 domain-containing protein [Campylobacter upsaliensis]